MKNPKVAASVMGSLTATAYTLDKYNRTIDENWREKIPEYKINKPNNKPYKQTSKLPP